MDRTQLSDIKTNIRYLQQSPFSLIMVLRPLCEL